MATQVSPKKEVLLSVPPLIKTRPLPSTNVSISPPAVNNGKAPGSGNQCVVCEDLAPISTVFRRHYGVICCEACKCFFRRTVQMGRDYKCRFAGACPIGRNAINIKQVCQACRFNRCTQAGMKIDSVKKFPRKSKDSTEARPIKSSRRTKTQPLLTPASEQNGAPLTPPIVTMATDSPDKEEVEVKQEEAEDLDYESDFDQFKFNISSPDLSVYSRVLESTIPRLFSGESLENIHEKSSIPTPGSTSEESSEKKSPQILITQSPKLSDKIIGSPVKIAKQPSPLISSAQVPPPTSSAPLEPVAGSNQQQDELSVSSVAPVAPPSHVGLKRAANSPNINWNEILLKKQRLEDALNHITARQVQVQANLQRLSVQNMSTASYLSHQTTPTIILQQNPSPNVPVVKQEHASFVVQDHTPYATPHETPHGTPVPSPLPPSPHINSYQAPLHYTSQPPTPRQMGAGPASLTPQNISQPGTPINGSLPTSPVGYKGVSTPTNTHGYFFQNQSLLYHGPTFPTVSSMACLVAGSAGGYSQTTVASHLQYPPLPPPQSVARDKPFAQLTLNGSSLSSLPGSVVTSPVGEQDGGSLLPSPSFTHDSHGKLTVEVPEGVLEHELASITSKRASLTSAPSSTCPSPLLRPSRTLASDAPEAEIEDVLESLKQGIKYMFKWAKSEVKDFDDLSPMDQKALLRRTVPELVMLGFARASIPYEDMLFLGVTGKVITPSNSNSGVSAVAFVTLTKLVVPLKVLNVDDHELKLMKEIVLFNPESNCLRDRETIREYRKKKHIELMEYSERNEPGRFGELLCLLTPLYEVSMEVTEQLRLEQFVHEGEARIDALLLMSMINQGGGSTEESLESGDPVM